VRRARGSALVHPAGVGPVTGVVAATVGVRAGGPEAALAGARPVLEALGEVRHVGGLGSGARLKLVANSMLGVVSLGAAELLAAGERAGLEREVVFSILTRFVPSLEGRRRGYVEGRHSPPMFAIRDLVKDLDLGLGLFHGAAAPVPVIALVRELVAEAALLEPEADISAVAARYAREQPVPAAAKR
jgi:3-hydroxyisobutyrate dehydrogenase-like beta-hydroxyacid dehydrogenase